MMRFLFYLLVIFGILHVSCCAPLKIGVVHGQDDLRDDTVLPPGSHTHTPEQLETIRVATEEAHRQILDMKTMMDNNHADLDAHLRNAFGEHYNKEEIHKTVNQLATGVIDIGRTNAPSGPNDHNLATTFGNSKTARVMFTENFHKMNPEAQAGTVLHEATHAISATKDYFHKDPNNPAQYKPISSLEGKGAPPGAEVKSGYLKGPDFNHLKENASPIMHKNADSFKVFGHTATHGLNAPHPPTFPPGVNPHSQHCAQPEKKGACNVL